MWSSYDENGESNIETKFKKINSEENNKVTENILLSEIYETKKSKNYSSSEKIKIVPVKNFDNSIYTTDSSSNLIDAENPKNSSVWKRFKNRVSNMKNNLIYNTLTLNSFLDYYKFKTIRLFDQSYFTKDDLDEFCQEVYKLPYFSYRSQISPILHSNSKNKDYESDCGWGCMIRAAQMILAKGVISIKTIISIKTNNQIDNSGQVENQDEIPFVKLAQEIIALFLDDINSSSNRILTPYSIQNICNSAKQIKKEPGEWFSDVNMTYIFSQINEELNPIKNLEIFRFTEGVIYGNQIRKKIEENFQENYNNKNDFKFSDEDSKSGIIFVSLRLGIEKISSSNVSSIKEIFEIPGNIGIIGGKANNAHYFIGTAGDFLLYLDPHFNQKALSREDFQNKNFSTYFKKQIYQISIKSISPAFTIGFYFCGKKGFDNLIMELEKYSNKNNSIFKYKNDEPQSLQNFQNFLIDNINIDTKITSKECEYEGSNSGDDF